MIPRQQVNDLSPDRALTPTEESIEGLAEPQVLISVSPQTNPEISFRIETYTGVFLGEVRLDIDQEAAYVKEAVLHAGLVRHDPVLSAEPFQVLAGELVLDDNHTSLAELGYQDGTPLTLMPVDEAPQTWLLPAPPCVVSVRGLKRTQHFEIPAPFERLAIELDKDDLTRASARLLADVVRATAQGGAVGEVILTVTTLPKMAARSFAAGCLDVAGWSGEVCEALRSLVGVRCLTLRGCELVGSNPDITSATLSSEEVDVDEVALEVPRGQVVEDGSGKVSAAELVAGVVKAWRASLREVKLCGCALHNVPARMIAAACRAANGIETLELSSTQLSDEGMSFFLDAGARLPRLKTMAVRWVHPHVRYHSMLSHDPEGLSESASRASEGSGSGRHSVSSMVANFAEDKETSNPWCSARSSVKNGPIASPWLRSPKNGCSVFDVAGRRPSGGLGRRGVVSLMGLVRCCRSLKELRIVGFGPQASTHRSQRRRHPGNLCDAGAVALAGELRGHRDLERLIFCGCDIRSRGALALAQVVPTMPSLREVDLGWNGPVSKEAEAALRSASAWLPDKASGTGGSVLWMPTPAATAEEAFESQAINPFDHELLACLEPTLEMMGEILVLREQAVGEASHKQLPCMGCFKYRSPAVQKSNFLKALVFVERGGDPNFPGKHGETLLHYAAEAGEPCAVLRLIELRADVDAESEHEETFREGERPLEVCLRRRGGGGSGGNGSGGGGWRQVARHLIEAGCLPARPDRGRQRGAAWPSDKADRGPEPELDPIFRRATAPPPAGLFPSLPCTPRM